MRGLDREEIQVLLDADAPMDCGPGCADPDLTNPNWGLVEDPDFLVHEALVRRGLMLRHECEHAIHFRSTPTGIMIARALRVSAS